MKQLLLLLLFFTPITKIIAQPAHIYGKIKDSATGNPLAYVTVHLLTDSNVIVKNTFSDSLGLFHFNPVEPGTYSISCSRAGYKNLSSPLFTTMDSTDINTGEHILSPNMKQLNKVVVFSKKPLIEKSTDGLIYNVQQDLLSGGGTAIDVLRKTPLVSVSQDGTPSIRGSSNIRVFIDDKPSDIFAPTIADALRQIPAEEIIKVEVILYPSAKYDAEGTDGVINIITRKKNTNGFNGTAAINAGPRYQNVNSSLKIRQQKWIFSTDAGSYLYQNKNGSQLQREDVNNNLLLQQNEWKNKGQTFYSGLNIIYLIDSLKNIYGGYRFRMNSTGSDRESLNDYFSEDSATDSFRRNSHNTFGNSVNSVNAGYNSKSKNQRDDLKLFISWFRHRGYNNYQLQQLRENTVDYKENFKSHTKNKELTLQADYTRKLNNFLNMEAGVKSSNRRLDNTNDFEVFEFPVSKFVEDNVRGSQFVYRRGIYAGYGNLNISLKTWTMRAGGRYEQTVHTADFKDTSLNIPDYKNFIPSILISKNLAEGHTIKLSYTKQILRPYLSYLSPAVIYRDSLNQEFGNPYLLPEVTHRYELGYIGSFKKINGGVSLFYNRNRNSIENIRTPGDNGIFKSTYQNIGRKEAIGLSGNISWRNEKFSVNTNFTLRYMMLKSAALQLTNNGYQLNSTLNVSWKLSKGYSIEGLASINSNDIQLQGSREGWKYFSLSLNKKLNQDKLILSLRTETYNRYITEKYGTPQFYQRTDTRYQNLFILFGLSWKFGKKEVRMPVTQQAATE